MLPLQRQNDILEILSKQHVASVEDLCKQLYSSGATIRRDLKKLEADGLIKRTHGGAASIESTTSEFPLALRESENMEQKDMIAQKALRYIRNGQTIFLDSSSTVCRLARYLKNYSDITVVTNGIRVADILADYKGVKVYCAGGMVRQNAKSIVGSAACEFISHFHADLAFMSSRGIDLTIGATVPSEDEANIKRAFINSTKRPILLFDSSKLDTQYFCRICHLNQFWQLICDIELPKKYQDLQYQTEQNTLI